MKKSFVRSPIEWAFLAKAIAHYTARGYEYVETPWIVPEQVSAVTFGGKPVQTDGGVLVGSAEQGFLALDLPVGHYVSCGPCFRQETIDRWHVTEFMKVELYVTDMAVPLSEIIQDAVDFLENFCDCLVIPTDDGFDITAKGVELGSYGRRSCNGKEWQYGTGVALPRLSQVTDANFKAHQ